MALTSRNPGPAWGYRFLSAADALLPRKVFEFLVGIGVWIAVACMPEERRHSRAYLTAVFGRAATTREVWRHFFTFARMLMRKLRAADGQPFQCEMDPASGAFSSLMALGQPALLGTFHVGDADLLGFMLSHFRRRIFMIRLQVENSPDLLRLADRFDQAIRFIWVNESEDLVFALKDALQAGGSVAMQCDRPNYSAKLEPFLFLSERRLFPVTIYHLSLIFRLPVVFCLGIPQGAATSRVCASEIFAPDGQSKDSNLARARIHFQAFLGLVEAQLRLDPYLWFNFTPLNPVAPR